MDRTGKYYINWGGSGTEGQIPHVLFRVALSCSFLSIYVKVGTSVDWGEETRRMLRRGEGLKKGSGEINKTHVVWKHKGHDWGVERHKGNERNGWLGERRKQANRNHHIGECHLLLFMLVILFGVMKKGLEGKGRSSQRPHCHCWLPNRCSSTEERDLADLPSQSQLPLFNGHLGSSMSPWSTRK